MAHCQKKEKVGLVRHLQLIKMKQNKYSHSLFLNQILFKIFSLKSIFRNVLNLWHFAWVLGTFARAGSLFGLGLVSSNDVNSRVKKVFQRQTLLPMCCPGKLPRSNCRLPLSRCMVVAYLIMVSLTSLWTLLNVECTGGCQWLGGNSTWFEGQSTQQQGNLSFGCSFERQ
jgi:hypothetical protein